MARHCPKCGKVFKDKDELTEHVLSHSSSDNKEKESEMLFYDELNSNGIPEISIIKLTDKPTTRIYKCNKCEKSYTRERSLIRHKTTHLDKKKYKCKLCNKNFLYLNSYISHKKTHKEKDTEIKNSNTTSESILTSGSTDFYCIEEKNDDNETGIGPSSSTIQNFEETPNSNVIYFQEASLDNFCKTENDIECIEIDDKDFEEKPDVIETNDPLSNKSSDIEVYPETNAMVFQEDDLVAENSRKNIQKTKTTCEECGEIFKKPSDLADHKLNHDTVNISGNKFYKCTECNEIFNNIFELKNHKVIHKVPRKQYKCTDCFVSFTYSSELLGHMETHKNKPIICLECGLLFNSQNDLELHIKTHIIECKTCGKYFNDKEQLKTHESKHDIIKKFKCNVCNLRFPILNDLLKHEKLHKARPFKCKICDKTFMKKFDVERHGIVHSGLKPYKCNDCGKCFGRPSDLVRHTKIHTGERPFKCDICGKSYIESCKLKLHKRKFHPDNKLLNCIICGKQFDNITKLEKHQLTCEHYDLENTTNNDDNQIIIYNEFDKIKNESNYEEENSLIIMDDDKNLYQQASTSQIQNYVEDSIIFEQCSTSQIHDYEDLSEINNTLCLEQEIVNNSDFDDLQNIIVINNINESTDEFIG